jgi:non-ribosomal peptide synthase protein (TIGR01720 family)
VEIDWEAYHAGERRRRVPLPSYPFQRHRYWIEPGREAPAAAALDTRRNDLADWFYVPSWLRTGLRPGPTEIQTGPWLLFVDEHGVGQTLANALQEKGCDVVRVSAADGFTRKGPDDFAIDPSDAGDYESLIGALDEGERLPERILQLWSLGPGGAGPAAAPDHLGFYSLTYLVQALGTRDLSQDLRLLAVTTEVHDVTGEEPLRPEKATVLGACRVIGAEYPFTCRNLDVELGRAPDAALVEAILAEVESESSDPVVAYRGRYRWAEAFRRSPLEPAPERPPRLREGGTYLITGGLGGMGLELAAYLGRTLRANLVLVGRTPLPAREEWERRLEESAPDDPTAARIRRVREIEDAGARVLVCSADVADREQMSQAVADARAAFGRIHGVIHAAGVPGGGILQRQGPDTAEPVFAPKIAGTRVLDALFEDAELDFLLLFSSMISYLALAGRAEYTAANAFVDAFARQKARESDSPVIAVNWDTWAEVGMAVTQSEASRPSTAADAAIRSEEGIEAFRRILGCDHPQVIVSVRDFQPRNLERIMNEKAAGGSGEATERGRAHPRPDLSTEYVGPRSEPERILVGIWEELLGIDRVGVHDNLFELGGDSVVSIQITGRARRAGLKLTPKQTFEHQTIAELAAVAGASTATEEPEEVSLGDAPLTPIQRWFFDQDLPDPHHFNQARMLEVRRPLDEATLAAALRQLVERHDALRLRFAGTGAQARQTVVAPGEEVAVRRVDLSGLAPEEQRARVEALAAELQRGLDLAEGPLLAVGFADLGPDRPGRLLWVVHHLAVDAVSWRILLEDLQIACEQLCRGEAVSLPPRTTSFRRWARQLEAYAGTGAPGKERDHWLELCDAEVAPLPLDDPAGENTMAAVEMVSVELEADETRALLQDAPKAYNTQINDLLLTALGKAFQGWTGRPQLFVDLEGHGREAIFEDVDLSRTVGWFTSMYPVLLTLPERDDPGEAIKSVKEQLRGIPSHGMNFGVLRYLSPDAELSARLAAVPRPEVVFLYMGRFDGASAEDALFAAVPESMGLERSPRGRRSHLLEITGVVAGDRLRFSLRYNRSLHRAGTIQALATSLVESLRALLAHCRSVSDGEFTPSDFPAARLSQGDLDRLAASLGKVGGTGKS